MKDLGALKGELKELLLLKGDASDVIQMKLKQQLVCEDEESDEWMSLDSDEDFDAYGYGGRRGGFEPGEIHRFIGDANLR